MYGTEYVKAMRRETDPTYTEIPEPECSHGAMQWMTEDGTLVFYWFEDSDGLTRCCHPDCSNEDWHGDYYADGFPAWAPEYVEAVRGMLE